MDAFIYSLVSGTCAPGAAAEVRHREDAGQCRLYGGLLFALFLAGWAAR